MTEYKYENATVRIHEGKYTAEERRAVLEDAAREFYRAVMRSKARSKAAGNDDGERRCVQ